MKEKLPDDLPSLCPCHSSLWKSDPNLCARNCQYYQNHSSEYSIRLTVRAVHDNNYLFVFRICIGT